MSQTKDKAAGKAGTKPEADLKTPSPAPTQKPPADDSKPAKVKQVRIICEGTLGPKLLQKGDVTDDPAYVAILSQKGQKKVEEVK